MRAWDERHPGWIRAHVHENLLAAPEAATRALLSTCGLPFDAACLRFERVEREVHTASAAQVPFVLMTYGYHRGPVEEIASVATLDDFPELATLLHA